MIDGPVAEIADIHDAGRGETGCAVVVADIQSAGAVIADAHDLVVLDVASAQVEYARAPLRADIQLLAGPGRTGRLTVLPDSKVADVENMGRSISTGHGV